MGYTHQLLVPSNGDLLATLVLTHEAKLVQEAAEQLRVLYEEREGVRILRGDGGPAGTPQMDHHQGSFKVSAEVNTTA